MNKKTKMEIGTKAKTEASIAYSFYNLNVSVSLLYIPCNQKRPRREFNFSSSKSKHTNQLIVDCFSLVIGTLIMRAKSKYCTKMK